MPLTLSEKATSGSHDWLFEFKNEQTGQIKYCSAEDISSYPDRYNLFVITDSAVEDAYNGTLNFDLTTDWSYKVYEMPVASPPSLTPTGYLAIVETGSVKVVDNSPDPDSFFDEDDDKDNAVFDEP